MSYIINYSGGQISIPVGASDTSNTSLQLIGRNWTSANTQQGYGQSINQNFVSLLENFANSTTPNSPLKGQLWYDTSTSEINLNTGTPSLPLWEKIYTTESQITHIDNGLSNVSIPDPDGNVNTSINGIANIFVVSSIGANVEGNITASEGVIANTLTSIVPSGTAPIVVNSTSLVPNLNSQFANGYTAVYADTPSTIVVRDSTGGILANVIRANTTISAPTGNITTINSTTISGRLATSNQPNITSLGTLVGLMSSGTVTAPDFTGNVTGNVTGDLTGRVNTSAQPNITSLGTLTSLQVAGNISGANIVSTRITTLGTVNFIGTSNVSLGDVGNIKIAGGATGSFLVTNGSGGLSWSTSTTPLSVGSLTTTAISSGSNTTVGMITGRWSLSTGSRLTATYADLAEYYTIDKAAGAGTVVEFGGECEITVCDSDMSQRVAGVVSTAPAFTMNDDGIAVGKLREAVALQGRVPCKVVGLVTKGDMMVSAGNGHARSESSPLIGSVIGKALEHKTTEGEGIIEVVVGRL